MREFIIDQNDAGQRLDKFLTKAMPKLPASLLYKYVRLKRVKLNGKRCEIKTKLVCGDRLSLYINDEFFGRQQAADFASLPSNIAVAYEDANILVAQKPAGLLCHDDSAECTDTLILRIKAYLFKKGEYNPDFEQSFAPALCNRIDRNTSGLVIAAKTAEALRILNKKIKNREIRKTYLAVAVGRFAKNSGKIKNFLFKNEEQNRVYSHEQMIPGAKTAESHYRVLDYRDGLSLVEVELITGRTHQIRAHLAGLSHPLLGDGKYGSEKINRACRVKTQLLQSYKLRFDFVEPSALDYLKGREIVCPEPLSFAAVKKFPGE